MKEAFAHSFTYEGRTYTLYKRNQSSEAPWQFCIKRDGKKYRHSLDTNIQSAAVDNAKLIIKTVKAERFDRLDEIKVRAPKAPPVFATIGQVLVEYEKAKIVRRPEDTRNALLNYLRIAGDGLEKLSTSSLTDAQVRKFLRNYIKVQSVRTKNSTEDARKRSANSILRQARSVFSTGARSLYRDNGLLLPDLRAWLDEPGYPRVTKDDYNPPDDSLIAKTFAEFTAFKNTDLNAYIAICLACGAGLRKGEIARVRRNSFVTRDGIVYVTGIPQKKGGLLDVPILEDWYQRIVAVIPPGATDDYLLTGHETERSEWTFRRIAEWMRALGWKTQKAIHEFRAYVGSKVADEHGIGAASQFLRHADPSITKRAYSRYMTMKKLVNVKFGPIAA